MQIKQKILQRIMSIILCFVILFTNTNISTLLSNKIFGLAADEVNIGTDIATAWTNWIPISKYSNGVQEFPGQWSYDATNGFIVNAENTDNMTGFYNPATNYEDLDISIDMGTWCDWRDNDYLGCMIRFSEDVNHNVTGYVFMMPGDAGGWPDVASYGPGLYKIVGKQFDYNNLEKIKIVPDLYYTYDTYHTIRLVASGTNIKVYVDGSLKINVNDSSIAAGSYGFFSLSQDTTRYKGITGKATLASFTATFDANGGSLASGQSSTKTVVSTKTYGTLPTVNSRTGYTFEGWYSAKTGGYKITSSSTEILQQIIRFMQDGKG